jgi:hypothetical protein
MRDELGDGAGELERTLDRAEVEGLAPENGGRVCLKLV